LVALSTYEQGYSKQARELAYIIIKHDPGYILPHQIIAYTSIADASYIQARKSLLTLIALDTTYTDTYRLLLGKVSYTMGEYTDAIIYLKQIQD
jgi:tetratricopeptide (TPR) repeat protein